jgi:hypothetical protein
MDSEDIVRKFHQKRGRIRDPRSGIRKKFIPDPGGKKAPDPGSGSATLVGTKLNLPLGIWMFCGIFASRAIFRKNVRYFCYFL